MKLLLFVILLMVLSLNGMKPFVLFDGDVKKAQEYIKEKKVIKVWMFDQALQLKDFSLAQVLIDEGKFPLNQVSTDKIHHPGWAPMHVQAHFNNAPAIEFLLRNGANINIKTNCPKLGQFHEATPLHFATEASGLDYNALRLLVENNADLKAKDSKGRTPIVFALSRAGINFLQQSETNVIKMILKVPIQ